MTWPDTLDLDLTTIAQGGAAVGRYAGRVVFAYGGLPGERVTVRLQQRQKSFASGTVSEVHRPSPQRVALRDPQASHADWQFIAYDEQLRLKAQIVAEQLAHLGALGRLEVAPTLASPRPWAYRNTATLHGDTTGRLGYYAPGSRQVLDCPADPLLQDELNLALAGLRQVRSALPALMLSTLTLRANRQGQLLAILETPAAAQELLPELARRWMAAVPQLVGVLASRQRGLALVAGVAGLTQELAGLPLYVSATSFFQVNSDQAEALVALTRSVLAPRTGMRLVDAYCGVGAFALPLAAEGALVVGIESHAGAIADAQRSAAGLGLRVDLQVGRVESLLPRLAGPYDAVLLDPPRRGLEPAALAALIRLRPPQIVYVSCHPGTLARDLGHLSGAGYRVRLVQPVDMFPQTHHIETLVLLE